MLVESLSAESQSNGEEGVERASRNKPRDQEHKSLSNTNKTRPGRLTQTSTVTSGKLSGGRERQHGHEKTFPSINTLPSPSIFPGSSTAAAPQEDAFANANN